jgi:hypothetical protein
MMFRTAQAHTAKRTRRYDQIISEEINYSARLGGVVNCMVNSIISEYDDIHDYPMSTSVRSFAEHEITDSKWVIHLYDLLGKLN